MTWNPRIEKLQRTLNARLRPSPNLKADGEWGPQTQAAWNAYSRMKQQASAEAALVTASATSTIGLPHGERAELWMSIARAELNVAEVPGSSNPAIGGHLNAISRGSAQDDPAWCSTFANWVMKTAGFPTAGLVSPSSWRTYGVECAARYGAITVLLEKGRQLDRRGSGGYVGFLEDLTPSHFRLLGGNQMDRGKVGVWGFNRARYTVLGGFRWPEALTDDPASAAAAGPPQPIA